MTLTERLNRIDALARVPESPMVRQAFIEGVKQANPETRSIIECELIKLDSMLEVRRGRY